MYETLAPPRRGRSHGEDHRGVAHDCADLILHLDVTNVLARRRVPHAPPRHQPLSFHCLFQSIGDLSLME